MQLPSAAALLSWAVSWPLAWLGWLNDLPAPVAAAVGALCVIALAVVGRRAITWLQFMIAVERLPGPMALPLLGNSLQLLGLMVTPKIMFHKKDEASRLAAERFRKNLIFLQWREKYQPLFRIWIGPVAAIVVTDPACAREVLGPKGPLTKSSLYRFIHPWLKTGLLTSSGEKWRRRRKLITPSFHFEALHIYFATFVEQAEVLANVLDARMEKSPDGVHIYRLVTNATLDIISKCAFGHSVSAQSLEDRPAPAYVQAVNTQTELLFERVLKPWYWNDWLFGLTPAGKRWAKSLETLHGHSRSVIAERRTALAGVDTSEGSGFVPANFLETLLTTRDTEGKLLSNEAVQEEVDTFLFEGHDTTASAITWALYHIGCLPSVQQRCREEVDSILVGDTKPTIHNIKRMTYLEAVLKEALRLGSPVPFMGRKVERPMKISGHTIPAGTQIFVCPVILHRHEETWPDSWTFKPERFVNSVVTAVPRWKAGAGGAAGSSATKATTRRARARSGSGTKKQEPFAFVPFSAGSRGCIGRRFAQLEETVILATLLKRFVWDVPEDQDVEVETRIITRPKHGRMRIRFRPRSEACQAASARTGIPTVTKEDHAGS